MNEFFDDIIEKDEQIIKIFKPSKKRYWMNPYIFVIPLFWPHLIIMLVGTLFTLPFFYANGYKNLYYAYTNKRLIVRSGMVGVDYQSLEYKDLTSTATHVNFLDKCCKTGSLEFISPSAHGKPIKFDFIKNPYEVMREIKEYINTQNIK